MEENPEHGDAGGDVAPANIRPPLSTSLFPPAAPSLFPAGEARASTSVFSSQPSWLSNPSFSEAILAVTKPPLRPKTLPHQEGNLVDENEKSFHSVSSVSEESSEEEDKKLSSEHGKKKKRRKRHEKRERYRKKKKKKEEDEELNDSKELGILEGSQVNRKASKGIWIDDDLKTKEYYFDTRGDADNVAFGSLYKMDVPRYYLHHVKDGVQAGKTWRQKITFLDPEVDSIAQDEEIKSSGRYWSAKISSVGSRRDMKRLKIATKRDAQNLALGDFVPLQDLTNKVSSSQLVEESWEDYVIRRTKEFNQLTREQPNNEVTWISFANFQDEIMKGTTKKVLVQHIVDKKIAVLEKAREFLPDSEDIVILYLETCRKRDTLSVLLPKWEKALNDHPDSYRLWQEYLKFQRSSFSSFSVSSLRKVYLRGIQCLIGACYYLYREEAQKLKEGSWSPRVEDAEKAVISLFIDLCRFEWQTGHHELAIGLLQAEFEYAILCPPIQLNETNKQRLFEAFWDSGASRIGEEGALGWATWLEKEEEQLQKLNAMKTDLIKQEENKPGGWTGWDEPKKEAKTDVEMEDAFFEDKLDILESGDMSEDEVDEVEDDAALLEKLGLSLDHGEDVEIKDTQIWKKWSEKELQREGEQWLPLRQNVDNLRAAGSQANLLETDEDDDKLQRMVLFDDIRDFIFSIRTDQAKFELVGQFVDFFSGPLSQWSSSNSRSYREKVESAEALSNQLLADISCASHYDEARGMCREEPLRSLVGTFEWVHNGKGRAGFASNSLLLLRYFFPSNLELQQTLLTLEGMKATDESREKVAASRSLAKRLLKASRQDLIMWVAYASIEASAGNLDIARKIFDNALTSLNALPSGSQEDASVLFLQYAEVELGYNVKQDGCGNSQIARVLYILHFLGTGDIYLPASDMSCTLTSTQLLRARRGFHEQLKNLQKICRTGELNGRGFALVICAAMFEELSTGWEAAASIFENVITMSLPGRRQKNVFFEVLLVRYISMLEKHKLAVKPSNLRKIILQAIAQYPFSSRLMCAYVKSITGPSLTNALRRFFDNASQKNPSTDLWVFSLSCELWRPGAESRIHSLFEHALGAAQTQQSVLLWRCYLAYELEIRRDKDAARRVFFRAIHACPWAKSLWLDGFQKMSSILTAKEQSELLEVMREKELYVRTDVYEILLEEADNLPMAH